MSCVRAQGGPWDFDAYVGVWLFTDNQDFFPGGATRSQDPVVALQGHASYWFPEAPVASIRISGRVD